MNTMKEILEEKRQLLTGLFLKMAFTASFQEILSKEIDELRETIRFLKKSKGCGYKAYVAIYKSKLKDKYKQLKLYTKRGERELKEFKKFGGKVNDMRTFGRWEATLLKEKFTESEIKQIEKSYLFDHIEDFEGNSFVKSHYLIKLNWS